MTQRLRLSLTIPSTSSTFRTLFLHRRISSRKWIELNNLLAANATRSQIGIPIHVVVCGHLDLLTDPVLSTEVIKNLISSKPAGVWLWFSRFDERLASKEQLSSLRWWVEKLSPSMSVFNLHGGFSITLSKFGMTGIAHGVGYGEQKDVVPVIGQSTPTVQYYVRALHGKYSVPLITRCFSSLGIKTPADFFSKICDCVICQGIIGGNLGAFAQYGEIHYSTPASRRPPKPGCSKAVSLPFLTKSNKRA